MIIGATITNVKRVPRVPDKTPAKYTPDRNRINASSLLFLLDWCQLARQKTDIPIVQKENGIGFPENNVSLPVWKLSKILSGLANTCSKT